MFPSAKAASEEVLGIDDNQSISISHSNLNLKNGNYLKFQKLLLLELLLPYDCLLAPSFIILKIM